MSVYLNSTVVAERTLASGDNGPFDLPVNPISFLLLHIRADAQAAAVDLAQFLAHITSIVVQFKGTSIISLNGADLFRLVHTLWGRLPNFEGFNAVSPALVSCTIPIPFTRIPFWPTECFPATRRGELNLVVSRAATLTNIANPVFAIESVELLEAEPTQFLKMVTLSKAIVVGDADMELPIGNPVLGMQIFSPTAMGNSPISETIRRARLLLDNVEYNVADTAFDIHRMIGQLRGADFNEYVSFPSLTRSHIYMDFDPLKDGSYKVDTEGRASVKLRFSPDVSGTVRVVPVEMVVLPGGAAA